MNKNTSTNRHNFGHFALHNEGKTCFLGPKKFPSRVVMNLFFFSKIYLHFSKLDIIFVQF